MKLGRRDLLKVGFAQALMTPLAKPQMAQAKPPQIKRRTLSILQGATDETRTQFSIVSHNSEDFQIRAIGPSGAVYLPDSIDRHSREGLHYYITKAYFSGLEPHQDYQLEMIRVSNGLVFDRRSFRTLTIENEKVRFAVCSCMDSDSHKPEIWASLSAQRPDVIFFIGDHVYADRGAPLSGADPDHLWDKFCEARQTLEIFHLPRLIPILATWDDHDFGLNDSDSQSYPYVAESQTNFRQFFAQDPAYCRFLRKGPGISSAFELGSQSFLLMDDRSFRLPKESKDRFAHWGQAQEAWALDVISSSRGPAWILNGSQIVPSVFWKESLSGSHPSQYKGFLSELRARATSVIFCTGDVHYSEVSKLEAGLLGYESFEITSSSVHSKSFPGVPAIVPNKRRIASASARNFTIIESKSVGQVAGLKVQCLGEKGNVLYERQLTVKGHLDQSLSPHPSLSTIDY
jgi:alkaline phosphatase D